MSPLYPYEPLEGSRRLEGRTLIAQIGRWNLAAISGGRVRTYLDTMVLPVGCGYHVEIALAGNDTYTVRRVFVRGGRRFVKGERTDVYADEVGNVAYYASSFRSHDTF